MKAKLDKEIVACFLAIGLSGSLLAATYTFPSGGGDLADLSRWQVSYPSLTDLPGSADTVRLGSASTFTMTSDMEVGAFSFYYKNATLDFAASGNHTLKVLNANEAFCAYNGTIKGGMIDRNGKDFYWFQESNKEMTLTDGCVLTNVAKFYVNVWGQSGGKIHLTGASRIYANALTLNKGKDSSTTSGCSLLEVTGGSKVFTTADWNTSENTATDIASGGNVLSVSGTGSSVTMTGNYIDGYDCNGNTLCVSDEGSFSSKSLSIGRSDASGSHYSNSNRLVVVGGTLNMTGGNLYCYGDNNVIAVTNSTVNFNNKTYSYDGGSSSNTTIDIVNSTWKCASFSVGKSVDMHISGSSTVLETTETQFGFGSSGAAGARLCFDDGFTWRPNIGNGYFMMHHLTNCALTVQNDATFSAWDSANDTYDRIIFCGLSGVNGVSNVVSVLSGGTIQGKTMELNGRDNLVVVSNGVVSATTYIQLGAVSGASNNTVVVQGSTPRLSAAERFYLYNYTTLRMEVPEDGYASGYVPITAQEFRLHENTCKFEIDVDRFQPKARTTLTLMSFNTDLTTSQKNFLLAAELPPRYSLDIVGNRSLVLKAKGKPKGFEVTFR